MWLRGTLFIGGLALNLGMLAGQVKYIILKDTILTPVANETRLL